MNLPFDYNLSSKEIVWWLTPPNFLMAHVCSLKRKMFTIGLIWRQL